MRSIISFWTRTSLVLKIFVGLIIGMLLGLVVPQLTFIAILGTLFISALKAMAPILVAVLVASALSKASSGLGKRFRTVITFYISTTLLAALVAVIVSFFFPVEIALRTTSAISAPCSLTDVLGNMMHKLTDNPVRCLTEANYIGILFWATIVGLGLKMKASERTISVVGDLAEVISTVIRWIIQFAPFGIMGIVFSSVAESGLEVFTTYGRLLCLLVGGMLFSALVINPILVGTSLRANPFPLIGLCLKHSAVSAFFTRSSAANIPVNMAICQRLGLDPDFYSVSIPLGATINMQGAAVTITVMTLAVCHTLGIEVSLPAAFALSALSTLGACGSSGVAGGSLLLIPMACSMFGIDNDVAMQAVAVGFVIGVVQDSMETALNSSSDVLFTITAELRDKGKKPSELHTLNY
ncbi:MAG: serine/threonine transporter SstT [Bacteroidales bacterium]|nr:serine/threonine transporter SstT [Bacteroidales bacterium]